ncbi:MAG: Veg family protein [Peptoniphilaceae bacterium]|nr:Veg family protein [Peptoniphilaceae bacterium]MDD7383928.1 Veg family protein [Peptoniphilaceae bacterium]MDY3738071.1 Veg family protein [Peptoniphilaceae bacterium]
MENTVDNIKLQVKNNIGNEVILKADQGRKKIVTEKGTIVNAFPSVFTVKINNDFDVERTVSYSYSDVLTSAVKLKFC